MKLPLKYKIIRFFLGKQEALKRFIRNKINLNELENDN